MLIATIVYGALLTGITMAAGPQLHDALLDKLVGKWTIKREFANRTVENVAVGEWVVDHHYLRVTMKDAQKPPQYEAHVYITYEQAEKRYAIHWMDVFAGSMPETMGYGQKVGDSIVFEWKDADGTLRNTFAWHSQTHTWTSKIEQTDKDGVWKVFCTDTYSRR